MSDESQRGRPSKYEAKFCEDLVHHMASGLSFESFGGIAHVSKQTLYTWADVHSEFMDAKELGTEMGRLYWEKQGIEGLYNKTTYENGKPVESKSINQSIWSQFMKNRFGWKNNSGSEVVVNNYAAKKDEEIDAKLREYGINPDTLKAEDANEASE